ncbi:hypothetical protein NNO_0132 [Hydrogenimonas sp.]|nr:hypothetical protein NNO_0132 [Hydrogenimonas sp.]
MQDIERKAIETFTKNMAYFSMEHPDLHKKIELLSLAIENGQYKEKYALEYKEDGYFDLLELESGKWLYGSSSSEMAKQAASRVNYSKNNGVIETFYNFKFDQKAVDTARSTDPTASSFATTAPVISYIDSIIDKNTTTMRHIYKFIFFGTGLGLHLKEIDRKIDANIYLIIEDDLEIFRSSLFVTDYFEIGKKSRLFFSIMENDYIFKETFNRFLHEAFIRNSYLKYFLFNDSYLHKIRKIQNFIVTSSHITYPHHRLLQKNIRTLETLREDFKFFDVSKSHNAELFMKRPVILVAAGPSLDKNIEWLKKSAEHATVVALFMTTPTLFRHGILPDVIVHVDEQEHPVLSTLSKVEDHSLYGRSVFFLSPSVEMKLFKNIIDKEKTYMFEDRTRYRFEMGSLEGFSVGEIAYALTLIWGTKELYLLGLDLALDRETGKTHSEGHMSAQNRVETGRTEEGEVVSLRGSTFEVKGNFGGTVKTTPLFDMSIHRINFFTGKLKGANRRVYNLNDGAFFEECIPTRAETVDLGKIPVKDERFTDELAEVFDTHADNRMSPRELDMFELRIKDAREKLQAVKTFSETRQPSVGQFQAAFTEVASHLITTPDGHISELSQILIIYLQNIGGYMGDFFNTKGVDNPKRHIKYLQRAVSEQLIKIIEKYLDAITAGKPAAQ